MASIWVMMEVCAIKNHDKRNGQLIQTNKKWSHLKEKQKTAIMEIAKAEYNRFLEERGKLPVHGSKKQLIEAIYDRIEDRDIWIPFSEVSRIISARIAHWNRVQKNDDDTTVTPPS